MVSPLQLILASFGSFVKPLVGDTFTVVPGNLIFKSLYYKLFEVVFF